MNPKGEGMVRKRFAALVVCVSVLPILLFIVTALRRVRYPYELEELEGYVFLSALRVFHGQPLYVPPSIGFTPYMYPPMYFYVAAGFGRLAGMTLTTLRIVSILSTLGCFGMIYAIVFGEVGRHRAAIIAAGLYAGCYTLTGCWFDLGRLDSLFILLMLLAMYATRYGHPVVGAALWLLCFFTKQTVLPVAFLMLCFDWRSLRRTSTGLLTLALGSIVSVVWADHLTHGWYSFYVFRVPAANAHIKLRTLAMFPFQDVLRPLGLAVVVIFAAVVLTQPSLRAPATRFYLASCSLVPLFWLIRAHAGSTGNADMPVYVLLAILFGISFARLETWIHVLNPGHAQMAGLLLLFGVLAQNAAGIFNPGDYVPPAEVRTALGSVIAHIGQTPGDIYVAQHPYYGWLAGKPVYADLISLHDAEQVTPALRSELQQELQADLTGQKFSAIAVDGEGSLAGIDSLAGSPSWRATFGSPFPVTTSHLPYIPEALLFHR